MSEKKEKIAFEAALKRLEEIVDTLESGSAPLEKSLELFEEGVRLSNQCNAELAEVEQKIELLVEKDGRKEFVDFAPEE